MLKCISFDIDTILVWVLTFYMNVFLEDISGYFGIYPHLLVSGALGDLENQTHASSVSAILMQ